MFLFGQVLINPNHSGWVVSRWSHQCKSNLPNSTQHVHVLLITVWVCETAVVLRLVSRRQELGEWLDASASVDSTRSSSTFIADHSSTSVYFPALFEVLLFIIQLDEEKRCKATRWSGRYVFLSHTVPRTLRPSKDYQPLSLQLQNTWERERKLLQKRIQRDWLVQ